MKNPIVTRCPIITRHVATFVFAIALLFAANVQASSWDWVTTTPNDGRTWLGNESRGGTFNDRDGYILAASPSSWILTENSLGGTNRENFVFEFANALGENPAWASIYSNHPGSFGFDNGGISYTTSSVGSSLSFGVDLFGNLSTDPTQSMLWQLARREEMRPFGGGDGRLTGQVDSILGDALSGNTGGAMIDSFFVEMTIGGLGSNTSPAQHIGMLAMDSGGYIHYMSQAVDRDGSTDLFFGFVADEGFYFTEALWFTTSADGQINMSQGDFPWGDNYRNNIGNVHWESINIGFGNGGVNAIPEPATIAIVGLGLVGLGLARAKRRKK
jgi:hypothetical protein